MWTCGSEIRISSRQISSTFSTPTSVLVRDVIVRGTTIDREPSTEIDHRNQFVRGFEVEDDVHDRHHHQHPCQTTLRTGIVVLILQMMGWLDLVAILTLTTAGGLPPTNGLSPETNSISTGRFRAGSFRHSRPPPAITTWVIDGTNLQFSSRSVPNDRAQILEALAQIASPEFVTKEDSDGTNICRTCNVVVIFDGNEDESFQKHSQGTNLEWVITDGQGRRKDRADNYIVDECLPSLQALGGRIHLVSADKELQKRVQASGFMNGGSCIHPPKFWKEILPNLQEQQRGKQPKKSRQ